jgi:hypothetical protein
MSFPSWFSGVGGERTSDTFDLTDTDELPILQPSSEYAKFSK